MDFDPKVRYNPVHGYAGVFMRVHNNRRYWDPVEKEWPDDTTRFGCFSGNLPTN